MKQDRTKQREVDGIMFDTKSDGSLRPRFHRIVFRITADNHGKSLSLCDEQQGIMIMIPVESVEDLIRNALN